MATTMLLMSHKYDIEGQLQLCNMYLSFESVHHLLQKSEGQSIVDWYSSIRLLKELYVVNANNTRKVWQSVDRNCTMKVTMHSTFTRLPLRGQKFHCAAWSCMVYTHSALLFKLWRTETAICTNGVHGSLQLPGSTKSLEIVHKSKAKLSHERQESYMVESTKSTHIVLCMYGHKHTAACVVERGNSSQFVSL